MTPKNTDFVSNFKEFLISNDVKSITKNFKAVCNSLEIESNKKFPVYYPIYKSLEGKKGVCSGEGLLKTYKKLASRTEYQNNNRTKMSVLIIGAGPSGLRLAIECALLGLRCHVVEKRNEFTRNNVLHLWDYTIEDLKRLGAKKFYPQFCSSSINHISIRRLQGILLKAALLLGVQVHFETSFKELVEPKGSKVGWHIQTEPGNKKLSKKCFDVIIGAAGRNSSLEGFELQNNGFKRKLAVAITANFVNNQTVHDLSIKEQAGINAPNNPTFFKSIKAKLNIDLENFVYYKSDTHYLIVTPKLKSLIDKGVIKQKDLGRDKLLARENINHNELEKFVRSIGKGTTDESFQWLDFAKNERGDNDLAIFDFSNFCRSKNSTRIVDRGGKKLLTAVVGDSLIAPFWPDGTGIAHGFLAAMDTAWAIKRFAEQDNPLEILCERESIYKQLPGITPASLRKNFHDYTIDPKTRYLQPIVNHQISQVNHLYNESVESQQIEEKLNPIDSVFESKYCLTASDRSELLDLPHDWKRSPITITERKRQLKIDSLSDQILSHRDKLHQKFELNISNASKLETLIQYSNKYDCQLSIISLEKALIEYQRCLTFAAKEETFNISKQEKIMLGIMSCLDKKNSFVELLDKII